MAANASDVRMFSNIMVARSGSYATGGYADTNVTYDYNVVSGPATYGATPYGPHDILIAPNAVGIQTDGSTSLTEVANNYYLDGSTGSGPALRYKGANITAGEFGNWTLIGAVKTQSGYDLPGGVPVLASTRRGPPTATATTKEI